MLPGSQAVTKNICWHRFSFRASQGFTFPVAIIENLESQVGRQGEDETDEL